MTKYLFRNSKEKQELERREDSLLSAGADPGFFLGEGAPPRNGVTDCQTTIFKAFNISSSASFYVLRQNLYTTDYLQNISCLWKPQVISGGHWTLPLDPPLLRPRRRHWQSFERARVSVFTCRTLNPNFTWSQAMHWRQYTQTDQSRAHESSDGSWGYNLNRFNVK